MSKTVQDNPKTKLLLMTNRKLQYELSIDNDNDNEVYFTHATRTVE